LTAVADICYDAENGARVGVTNQILLYLPESRFVDVNQHHLGTGLN
jgi:hypothetical protein